VGMTMVETTTFKRGATDFSSQMSKLKAANCDMVVLGTIIRETIGGIGTARKLGFNPIFLGSSAAYTDLIHKLSHTLLRKALAAASGWPDHIQISFNLSARDIASPESMAQIERIVIDSGVDPGRIDFEVTESALMSDFDQAMASIGRLRTLGTRISLDDFGTGYSSLSYVHRLPLDKIKIDRSFIIDIETRGSSRDILRTVLDLCRNLNISCVVEGMETAQQAEILRELGCRSMQGYYFARPMAQHDVLEFLAARVPAAMVQAA